MEAIVLRMKNNSMQTENMMYDIYQPLGQPHSH